MTRTPTRDPTVEPTVQPTRDPTRDSTMVPMRQSSLAPTEQCRTMLVSVVSVSNSSLDISREYWAGHYLQQNRTLFACPQWRKAAAEDTISTLR